MPQLTPDEERELRNWALVWAEAGHTQGRLILKALDRNRELVDALRNALETIEVFNAVQGEDPVKSLQPDG